MIDTTRIHLARAYVAAYDALEAHEHQADLQALRQIDEQRIALVERIGEREDALRKAQEAMFAFDAAMVDEPEESQPEAIVSDPVIDEVMFDEAVSDVVSVCDADYAPNEPAEPEEFSTPRANGAGIIEENTYAG